MTALAFERVTAPVIAGLTDDIVFDEKDAELLAAAIRYRAFHFRPLVGDYVVLADGTVQRLAYAYTDRFQVTVPSFRCSFHLHDVGTMSCSGAFPGSVMKADLQHQGYRRSASCWMWHHGRSGGGRGVDAIMPVAVWMEVRS
ncbi:hypothetical protein [Hyphomicrobium sp. DY-1]|jgi:hypothetical protein|uniref:hypothetical protein n=1 Tax=Hyphomicrobium sp. DY-1 TaxID=3075650 RepID=UPI0039C02966